MVLVEECSDLDLMTEPTALEWEAVAVVVVVVVAAATWEWEATKEWECLDMAWVEEAAMLKDFLKMTLMISMVVTDQDLDMAMVVAVVVVE